MSFKPAHTTLLAIFAILFSVPGIASAQKSAVNWETDLAVASRKAAATGKPIMIHFWRHGCSPCQQLESYVFSDAVMGRAINQAVIPVKLNSSEHQDLIRKYEVRTVPHDVVLSSSGDLIFKRVSPSTIRNYNGMLKMATELSKKFSPQANRVLQAFSGQQQNKNFKNNQSPFLGEAAAKFGRSDARVANRYAGQKDPMALPEANINKGNHLPVDQFSNVRQSNAPEFQKPDFPHIGGNALASNSTGNLGSKLPQLNNPKNQLKPTDQFGKQSDLKRQDPLQFKNPLFAGNNHASKPNTTGGTQVRQAGFGQASGSNSAVRQSNYLETPGSKQNTIAKVSGSSSSASNAVGLDGYCPVTLLRERKWVKGDKAFGCNHRNKLYFFASREKAADFYDHPDRFSPLLAGFDPVEFKMTGRLIDGRRDFGVFYKSPEGHVSIVLFHSPENRDSFKRDRKTYLEAVKVAKENTVDR